MTQEDGIALRARAEKDVAKQLTDMVEKMSLTTNR